jgi:cyanophycinase
MRVLLFIVSCLAVCAGAAEPVARGHLFVIGGGKVQDTVLKRALTLAGGPQAPIAILPQASELPDTGEKSADMWRALGAANITVAAALDEDATKAALRAAAFIWMPGGQQTRLMKALQDAEIPVILRERYRAGAVIGGTSAGAAVMSELMITGDADLESITPHATKLAGGLGLWSEVIVDQHFLKRQRFNRLFSAILDHPDKIGVGIDEGTVVIVGPADWEIIGVGNVLVIDARSTAFAKIPVSDARLHLLRPGMRWKP